MKEKRIVTSAAGSGHYSLLSGLKWLIVQRLAKLKITATVSVVDSGGDTGFWIRDEKGLLPPGDFAKCLVALSSYPEEILRKMFLTKFKDMGELTGHSPANMLFTKFHSASGRNPLIVLKALCQMFRTVGEILPAALKPATLGVKVEFESGKTRWVWGEGKIDHLVYDPEFKGKKFKIIDVRLREKGIRAIPEVKEVISKADLIIIGPGDLYTSVLPNLLIPSLAKAIRSSPAPKVYVCNIMTKHGETDGYKVSDFVRVVEEYLGGRIDYLICNNGRPPKRVLEKYAKENAFLVEPNVEDGKRGRRVISRNFLSQTDMARHDPKALALTIKEIVECSR